MNKYFNSLSNEIPGYGFDIEVNHYNNFIHSSSKDLKNDD
jgi:hypothetical protein